MDERRDKALTFVWFFLIAVLLMGCSQDPSLQPLHSGSRILAFGDSLTEGVGADDAAAYPAVLSSLTGLEVINAGISGEISAEGLRRLPTVLDRYEPDLVVLCHGGNDLLRKMDPALTKANLAAMIELIREHGAEVVLISVPEPGIFLSSADYYAEVAKAYDVPVEDDILTELQGDSGMKSDRVHFNAAGYSAMAQAVKRLMEQNGALP
ncbi:arylesterase [Saccharospirillum salsuginis]|uniref:Arylesterase n=1 Tax=Saccharospirillum salsuginis TaxID=418750 RepID=A0A918K8M5_9GAMM|nr:arylesterase [Saccharospirillum salsuginis]GGX52915.1 arylesterase [Saccharospirillum salsuginis]